MLQSEESIRSQEVRALYEAYQRRTRRVSLWKAVLRVVMWPFTYPQEK